METPQTDTGVMWMQVRDAAVSAVCRGWPVVPGTCRPDEIGFCEVGPLEDAWDLAPVTDPEHAQDIWTWQQSLGVLLVCGRGVDALEVPFSVVELVLGLGVPVVTALSPVRWLVLVATGRRRCGMIWRSRRCGCAAPGGGWRCHRRPWGDTRPSAGRRHPPTSPCPASVVFDPHATGECLITIDEDGATTLRDLLTEWLG